MSVTVSEVTYYNGGAVAAGSELAGYVGSTRRVVRYTLSVDGEGAGELSVYHEFSTNSGVSAPTLCMNLSTDGNAYVNANGTESGYLATMSRSSRVNAYEGTLTGLALVPGVTYYLWVYPMTDAYEWVYYHANSSYWSVTASGSAGLVYFDNGSQFDGYLAYIDNGSSWDLYIPYIDNGSGWDLCA